MNIYENGRYKKLFIIPMILLLILLFFATTRLNYGMDFQGGTRITAPLEREIDTAELEIEMNNEFDLIDLDIRKTEGADSVLIVSYVGHNAIMQMQEDLEAGRYNEVIQRGQGIIGEIELEGDIEGEEEIAEEYLSETESHINRQINTYISEKAGSEEEYFSIDSIGAAMGQQFLMQARNAILAAILFISILVFYFFRKILVSLAVFQAPIYDMIFGLGAMGLFQIPLTLGTVAALLMVIGYSIDSDIMLTMKTLGRKEGTPEERAFGAMKTGLTMSITTVSALIGLLIISHLTQIHILVSISLILILGLIGDTMTTWFINAPIMIWLSKRENR